MYIHAIELDSAGNMVRRRIFADMSSDEKIGVPDGMKVDVEGRVYCTGPGGTWVFAPDGAKIGIIKTPEVPANLCFGGPDMKTLFFTAHTSVYSHAGQGAGPAGPPVPAKRKAPLSVIASEAKQSRAGCALPPGLLRHLRLLAMTA